MYTKISIAGMCRMEWLKLRKTGIGGSDAGAICGLNPYASPMSVYLDKTSDTIGDDDNEAMRIGRDLESYVAQRFCEATGLKVRRSNYMYRSEEYPFMLADVDRLIVGEDAGLECKTVSPYGADKWKDGNIPQHYLMQCCHYMYVTGRRSWYLAVVILGQGFQYVKIDWDNDLIQSMVRTEYDFWNNYVIPGILPPPDGSDVCDEVLEQYFHVSKKAGTVPLVGFDEKLDRRLELTQQIKELERQQKQIDQEIKIFLGESELAASERYKVAWQMVTTNRLDTKRIKTEQPQLYQDYLVENHARKFTVKAA